MARRSFTDDLQNCCVNFKVYNLLLDVTVFKFLTKFCCQLTLPACVGTPSLNCVSEQQHYIVGTPPLFLSIEKVLVKISEKQP